MVWFDVAWLGLVSSDFPPLPFLSRPFPFSAVPRPHNKLEFCFSLRVFVRETRPGLELSLPHRLDIDTSGLVIVGE